MGIEALVPRPGTSKARPATQDLSLSLRGVSITESNQVWPATSLYSMALAFCIWWRLSTGPPGQFWRGACRTRWIRACITALDEALARHGKPKIFNTEKNQGAQFTSAAFTGMLEAAGIAISMDGRGRSWTHFIERLWRSINTRKCI